MTIIFLVYRRGVQGVRDATLFMRQYAQQFSLRGSGMQLDPTAFVINAVSDNIAPEAPLQRRPAKAKSSSEVKIELPVSKNLVLETRRAGGRSAGIEEDSYNMFATDESTADDSRVNNHDNGRSWFGFVNSMMSLASMIPKENTKAKPAELSSYSSSHGLLDASTRSVVSDKQDTETGGGQYDHVPNDTSSLQVSRPGTNSLSESSSWISQTSRFIGYFSDSKEDNDNVDSIIDSETVSSRKPSSSC